MDMEVNTAIPNVAKIEVCHRNSRTWRVFVKGDNVDNIGRQKMAGKE